MCGKHYNQLWTLAWTFQNTVDAGSKDVAGRMPASRDVKPMNDIWHILCACIVLDSFLGVGWSNEKSENCNLVTIHEGGQDAVNVCGDWNIISAACIITYLWKLKWNVTTPAHGYIWIKHTAHLHSQSIHRKTCHDVGTIIEHTPGAEEAVLHACLLRMHSNQTKWISTLMDCIPRTTQNLKPDNMKIPSGM